MSTEPKIAEVDYPESDGKPMGETDLHRYWMMRLYDLLSFRYRGRRAYVGCDLLLYYEEGNNLAYVVPDDFVALDCEPGFRRVFKVWEEGKGPDAAFEVTSRGTRDNDIFTKPDVYARIGVKDYILFDPTGDYLSPPLQGYRLEGERYRRIEPDATGALACRSLGILLRVEDGQLVLYDSQSGERLLTEVEAERLARQQTEREREAEQLARQEAERAREAAEDELRRLRERLNAGNGEAE